MYKRQPLYSQHLVREVAAQVAVLEAQVAVLEAQVVVLEILGAEGNQTAQDTEGQRAWMQN